MELFQFLPGVNQYSLLVTGFLAFLFTIFLTPVIKKMVENFGVMDQPDPRKIHTTPIPSLGGLAFVASVYLSLLFSYLAGVFEGIDQRPLVVYLIASLIIVIAGVIDDLKNLKPSHKLLFQIIAAVIVVYSGYEIKVISGLTGFSSENFYRLDELAIVKYPLTIFWLVGMINMINLTDGLDGLLAGISAISAFTLILIGAMTFHSLQIYALVILATIFGSTMGFLRYNVHPARIFMGDTGSMFIGFSFGFASVIGALKSTTTVLLLAPLIILAIPAFDMLFAVLRRKKQKLPIFKADRQHFHHRLLDAGFSHAGAVRFMYILSGLFSLLTIIMFRQGSFPLFITFIVSGITVGIILRIIAPKKHEKTD